LLVTTGIITKKFPSFLINGRNGVTSKFSVRVKASLAVVKGRIIIGGAQSGSDYQSVRFAKARNGA
jgi:hypothetical protein